MSELLSRDSDAFVRDTRKPLVFSRNFNGWKNQDELDNACSRAPNVRPCDTRHTSNSTGRRNQKVDAQSDVMRACFDLLKDCVPVPALMKHGLHRFATRRIAEIIECIPT
jgi:hypothetical protein